MTALTMRSSSSHKCSIGFGKVVIKWHCRVGRLSFCESRWHVAVRSHHCSAVPSSCPKYVPSQSCQCERSQHPPYCFYPRDLTQVIWNTASVPPWIFDQLVAAETSIYHWTKPLSVAEKTPAYGLTSLTPLFTMLLR